MKQAVEELDGGDIWNPLKTRQSSRVLVPPGPTSGGRYHRGVVSETIQISSWTRVKEEIMDIE